MNVASCHSLTLIYNNVTFTQVEEIGWNSWTCVLGHTMTGVWPPKCDVTDVNAAHVSRDKQLVATADDFGMVKLFNYPAMVS